MITNHRQPTLVSLIGLLAAGVSLCLSLTALAADVGEVKSGTTDTDLAKKLVGTWKLAKSSTPGSPSGIGTRLRVFTGTHWSVIQPDRKTGAVIFQHGGHYVLEGNQLKETVDFAGESTKAFIGTTGTKTIDIDGDTYTQIDPKGQFNETWKRVK